jgi:hypothetical protein
MHQIVVCITKKITPEKLHYAKTINNAAPAD